MWRFPCECADDMLPGVDAAGTAKFAEVFGKQRPECDRVSARGGLQELLFEMEEVSGEFLRAIGHGFG
jgi:hypothetical protein